MRLAYSSDVILSHSRFVVVPQKNIGHTISYYNYFGNTNGQHCLSVLGIECCLCERFLKDMKQPFEKKIDATMGSLTHAGSPYKE